MATTSFTLPCPSCEASVPVKQAQVGKKVECAKCKYRFVAESPEEEDDAEPAAAEAPAEKKGKKGKKKKKGGNQTVLVGALLGVLAVGVLGAGGYVLFGDSDSSTQTPSKGTPGPRPNPSPPTPPPTTEPKDKEPKPPPKTPTGPLRDPTNMLPNETVAVSRINAEGALQTPFYVSFFDQPMRNSFTASLAIDPDDVSTFIHCAVGRDRKPFVLLRTSRPIDEPTFWAKVPVKKVDGGKIKGREYHLMPENRFISAMARGFSGDLILEQLGKPSSASPQAPTPDETYAMYLFDDAQTMVIASEPVMVRYLNDLQANGYPKFLSEVKGGNEPKPDPKDPKATDPKTTPDPKTPKTPDPKGPKKVYTSVPTYRTIPPDLKRALNALEDGSEVPALVFADIVDQRLLAERLAIPSDLLPGVVGYLQQVSVVGAALRAFATERGAATLLVEFVKEDTAKDVHKLGLMPKLTQFAPAMAEATNLTVVVRNQGLAVVTASPLGPNPMNPNVPFPGGDGESPVVPIPRPGFPPTRPGVPPGVPVPPVLGPDGKPLPEDKTKTLGIDADVQDKSLIVSVEIPWTQDQYLATVYPGVKRAAAALKAKMTLLSGDIGWHNLAAVAPKLSENGFPAGTFDRQKQVTRFELPYPPETRVSFFADLLPFLGRRGLRDQMEPTKAAWYGPENLPAAEAWVPEFLVPYYPADTWRATHPLAPGKSLGATNYVGLAGLGRDAARLKPAKDPKKVGITGYDWGSKASDVTDGLSNTAYLIQVPPGYSRPWVAGGGATLVGVDETDPLADFVFPGTDGTKGAYVLMADGSVRWVKEGTDPKVFKAMVTRAGGEKADDLDKVAPLVPVKKPAEKEQRVEIGR